MYVDSSNMCNDLGFNLGGGASTVTRAWTIKVWLCKFLTKQCPKTSIFKSFVYWKWNNYADYCSFLSFLDNPIWLQLWQSGTRWLYPIFFWTNQRYSKNLQFWWWSTFGKPGSKHLYQVQKKLGMAPRQHVKGPFFQSHHGSTCP